MKPSNAAGQAITIVYAVVGVIVLSNVIISIEKNAYAAAKEMFKKKKKELKPIATEQQDPE